MKKIISLLIIAAAVCLNAVEANETTILLSEDFNSVVAPELPAGWTIENANNDDGKWKNEKWLNNPLNNQIIYTAGAAAADDWFFTKGIQLTGGVSYRVAVDYSGTIGYKEKLEIKWGNAPVSTAMSADPVFKNEMITNWNKTLVGKGTFTPDTDGIYYIGFHCFSDVMNRLMLDNVLVETAPLTPIFKATPAAHNFGSVKIPTNTLIYKAFVIENYGIGTLNISEAVIAGTDAAEFMRYDAIQLPLALGAGQSTTLKVKYLHTQTGSYSAVLKVTTDTQGIIEIPLSGESYNPSAIEAGNQPGNVALLQNYPNPFNNTTAIGYQLAKTGHVKLSVYNAEGKLVEQLVSELKSAGTHTVSFNAAALNSGLYYYVLETGAVKMTKKLILVK